ncbi:MAG TPA: glycoside hydrolase 100 family protein [Ktedonobacteraceae bacterium]|nr:glycoside hydrolase 100 family protein [Ktedonobacteraceae bacterium]
MFIEQMTNEMREAYVHALDLLRVCSSPAGFLASPSDVDNYARVWARDGVITGLAALASGESDLVRTLRQTLETLAYYQGPHGEIPSNVSMDGRKVSYGHLVGRVDAVLWYVIGVCAYLRATHDTHFQETMRSSVEQALFLAGCWEYNARGLIYTPLSGNWADEYIQQGYVLADQALYVLALQSAGDVFKQSLWREKATLLRELLTLNYWPCSAHENDPRIYHPHAYRAQAEQGEPVYWLSTFSPSGYTTTFDGLAHALILLAEIGSHDQSKRAEAYVKRLEREIGSSLLPAFWPVIQPGNSAWRVLEANHLYSQFKNRPYTYHNGGLWPMLTGLYAVGLTRYGSLPRVWHLLSALTTANAQGRDGSIWDFAEYHHGQTYEPMGTRHTAWSAAATILAHQALMQGLAAWFV